MDFESLNALPPDEAQREFLKCCGSVRWAEAMVQLRQHAAAEIAKWSRIVAERKIEVQ